LRMVNAVPRRSRAAVDKPVAAEVGARLRAARLRVGLTQTQLAGDRYTKAYISALEHGHTKPSVAALTYLAERLGMQAAQFLGTDHGATWGRLEADLALASGDWQAAADRYADLLEGVYDAGSRAEVLTGRAEALTRLDQPRDALAAAAEAARMFGELGRAADRARASYWQAYALYLLGQGGDARSILASLRDAMRGGLQVEPDFLMRVLMALAAVEVRDGQTTAALADLEEAQALAADLDTNRQAIYFHALASSYVEAGDYEAAIRIGERSLALYGVGGSVRDQAALDNQLALSYLGLGSLERARTFAASARRRFEAVADERWLAHVVETEAQIALAANDLDLAGRLASEARTYAERSRNDKALMSTLRTVAAIARRAGDLAAAAAALEEAATLGRTIGRAAQLADVLSDWAALLEERGDVDGAYRLTKEALELVRR
jgi:transcriptional regulator with XRE-family HTH domain